MIENLDITKNKFFYFQFKCNLLKNASNKSFIKKKNIAIRWD